MPNDVEKPYDTGQVQVGDVIFISKSDCDAIRCNTVGRYVVEQSDLRGGWWVVARLLDENGVYDPSGCQIDFYQDTGYLRYLPLVRVVGKMKQTFV
jgi:hypothetical protein